MRLKLLLLLALSFILPRLYSAEDWVPVQAQTAFVSGKGEFKSNKGEWKPLSERRSFKDGSFIVRTHTNSQIDIILGDKGPLLRLLSKTEIEVTLRKSANKTLNPEIQTTIKLNSGRISGYVRSHSSSPTYKVQVNEAEYSPLEGDYDICANGYVFQEQGKGTLRRGTNIVHIPEYSYFLPHLPQGVFSIQEAAAALNMPLHKSVSTFSMQVVRPRVLPSPAVWVSPTAGPFATSLAAAQLARGIVVTPVTSQESIIQCYYQKRSFLDELCD